METKFFLKFLKLIGLREFAEQNNIIDKNIYYLSSDILKELIIKVFKNKTLKEWKLIFDKQDCCVEEVLMPHKAHLSEPLKDRPVLIELENGATVPSMPLNMNIGLEISKKGGPLRGENNEEIDKILKE